MRSLGCLKGFQIDMKRNRSMDTCRQITSLKTQRSRTTPAQRQSQAQQRSHPGCHCGFVCYSNGVKSTVWGNGPGVFGYNDGDQAVIIFLKLENGASLLLRRVTSPEYL